MEENQDESQVLETETTDQSTEQKAETEQLSSEEIADLRRKAAERDDFETKNKQLYERAKKAETKAPSNDSDLSPRDVVLLMENKVAAEDIDDVVQAAAILKKPLAEALKSNVVRTLLAEKAEERRTANATQTRTTARGSSKVSGEELLAKAESTGEVPDTDEGMAALVAARQARNNRKKN